MTQLAGTILIYSSSILSTINLLRVPASVLESVSLQPS